MQKNKIGNLVVLLLVAVYPLLWLLTLTQIVPQFKDWRHTVGEFLAGTAMICMTVGLILAARPRFFEDFFGGLDKMYVTHRRVNTTALLLLVVHATLLFTWPPDQPGLLLGVIAFSGLSVLSLLSLAPRLPVLRRVLSLPYVIWHYLHRFIGIFFIVGIVHFLFVEPVTLTFPQGQYMYYLAFVGAAAYLYRQLIGRTYWLGRPYQIAALNPLNDSTLEIVLKPLNKNIHHLAGQFLFVQFTGSSIALAEPHPFTISSAPGGENLRLSIKASGDWTRTLRDKLKVGDRAKVQGGYGRFNYKSGGSNQLWIAGGIGITPFLSWIRELDGDLRKNVDFYYIVRNESDALFWNEVQRAVIENETLNGRLHISSRNGRLNATKITEQVEELSNKEIYMCGPGPMIASFAQQFKTLGVPAGKIHYEEFNFR